MKVLLAFVLAMVVLAMPTPAQAQTAGLYAFERTPVCKDNGATVYRFRVVNNTKSIKQVVTTVESPTRWESRFAPIFDIQPGDARTLRVKIQGKGLLSVGIKHRRTILLSDIVSDICVVKQTP